MPAADADDLDPASYPIPDVRATGGDPEKLAAAELRFTDAVLTYARHAQAGRFGAQRTTSELEVTQTLPDALTVLRKIAQASNDRMISIARPKERPSFATLPVILTCVGTGGMVSAL